MNKSQNLTKDDIPTLIKQLTIPASTGMFFNTMYNVVDTFYAGVISTKAISALSLSFMLFFMIIGLGYGFASAITALIGNSLGKNKKLLASIYAHKGILFIPLVGMFLMIIGFLYAKDMFILLGAKDDYLQICLDYIYMIFGGIPFFMLNYSLNSILVATGDTKSYRNTLIFGFFANLILNPLFIHGFLFIPAMGISGIAFATVLIQIINMLYLFRKVLKTKMVHFLKPRYFLPQKKIYKDFLVHGLPSSLNMLTMGIGSILLTYFVTKYGYKAVAGYGIGFRVEQIMLLPALGLSTAVLTLVSNNFGAKKYDRVSQTIYKALKYGFIICTFGVAFLYIFGELIVSQFDKDKEVISYATGYLAIEVWIFYAFVTLFICVSTLQAIKKPKMIFWIGLYRQIVAKYFVGYIIVIYFALDLKYFWMGTLVMIYSAAIFAFLYTRNELKKLNIPDI
ncbi:MATE family efflux transporter [Malaciobacter molluscorum LMG 25693]|uniref:MATE family efflux protein n=1 Tax=Malaciobacter molluscorum LMG 25693 TaxID=870501 RepID=A0A2G1DFZ1_9BACT|nr:MATE family efflux transporter [Malaciobacter molluscorum]AXX91127.1 MATE family efflux protein [Malaciobacter molluscorum LMG 25693]PHO17428.1 MATE family efflux transporter [Malaciobacter molluscorum LMG 25693]